MLKLSQRLNSIAEMVGECNVFADIGTDHAYLPLWLLSQGRVNKAIATDLRIGPLENGRANAQAQNLERVCEFRLGDGLQPIEEGEANCVCIAGMGGSTIMGMLQNEAKKAKSFPALVLEPQSFEDGLRLYLAANGFSVVSNSYAQEGRLFYQVIRVEAAVSIRFASWAETVFPVAPAEKGDGIYKEYLLFRAQESKKSLTGLLMAKKANQAAIDMHNTILGAVEERLRLY